MVPGMWSAVSDRGAGNVKKSGTPQTGRRGFLEAHPRLRSGPFATAVDAHPGEVSRSPPDGDRSAAACFRCTVGDGSAGDGLFLTLCSRLPWICHDVSVFIEQVTAPREEFELWDARLGMVTQPPPALALSVAWESDGVVTCINVWDSPQAIADFFLAAGATLRRGRRPTSEQASTPRPRSPSIHSARRLNLPKARLHSATLALAQTGPGD